jgi:hypothetical protein
MNKSGICGLLFCALLLWLAGCAGNKYSKTQEQFCAPALAKADAMKACEQVLADMRFTIQKSDVDAGLIITHPLTGAQSFEFWRNDSVGAFNQSEADLHSIRRSVEINISEQAGQLCINCRAVTQRLSLPQGPNYSSLTESYRAAQRLKFGRDQKTNIAWIDLGRDNQLETEIIKRIEKRIASEKRN